LYKSQIQLDLAWLLGIEEKAILSNLFFFEGAITVGLGALLAGGFAENRMTRTNVPSTAYNVEKISKSRPEFREKQISTGIILMITGLPLLVMSVLSTII
jgi:hypothetical protein